MDSGVARKPIEDMDVYERQLSARLDPTAASLQSIFEKVRRSPRRVVFAEGEEEKTIRAALAFHNAGLGTPILIGREGPIQETMKALGVNGGFAEIANAALGNHRERYAEYLYNRLKRKGQLFRDCVRMGNQNRNVFASCMVACGDADALITGLTRAFNVAYDDLTRAIDPKPGRQIFGINMLLHRGGTLFIADTQIHELPPAELIADIAEQAAEFARGMGHEPRVALLSFSSFGNPPRSEEHTSELQSRGH